MNTLATKLTVTAAIAALIAATPVSLDLARPNAAGPQSTAHLTLTLEAAQARSSGFGHVGGLHRAVGGAELPLNFARKANNSVPFGAVHGGLRAHFGQRDRTLIRRRGVGDSNDWINTSERR